MSKIDFRKQVLSHADKIRHVSLTMGKPYLGVNQKGVMARLRNRERNAMVYLNPEKHGIDGGKHVFCDRETPSDGEADKRLSKLESTLRSFKEELGLYSMTLKSLGYSTNENQKIILTLPFIATGLEVFYRKTVYKEGGFFNLVPNEK